MLIRLPMPEAKRALEQCRSRRFCEYCRDTQRARHAAHIFSKGAGEVTIPACLILLCWECHSRHHNGEIASYDLLAVAAVREGIGQDEIESVVWAFRRHRKELPIPEELRRYLA